MNFYNETIKRNDMKYHFRFLIGRTPEDPEKVLTPTIVFINTNHHAFDDVRKRGFMIILGWWDWSIKFGIIITKNKPKNKNQ